ncbi:hypothetical protein H0H93_006007 [Arthromyces matolae]|nr:hypothetical protein H0H93_006007 [Arthromyces matolae]
MSDHGEEDASRETRSGRQPVQTELRGPGIQGSGSRVPGTGTRPTRTVVPPPISPPEDVHQETILAEVDVVTADYEKGKISKPVAVRKVVALADRLQTTDE